MLGIAIIGAGHWGPNLIRNFHDNPISRVGWVVDQNRDRLQEVSARFPDARLGVDVHDVLTDPAVDAVVVATPTSTHYSLAKAALEAGKHVLVEKPITRDVAQAEELCRVAQTVSRVLMVGHVFLYNEGVRRVRQLIAGGDLGRVYYISMVRTNLGPIRVDVNAAWDLAPHDLSIANYWLQSEPISAAATGGIWINPGIEDAIFATLRYPGDVLLNLHVSWLSPRKARDITVVGDERMATLDDLNLTEPLRIYDKRVTEDRTTPGFIDTFASFRASVREGDITIPKIALGEPLKAQCDHFLECISSGTVPLTGGESGHAVVRALAAVEGSIRCHGQEVEVS